MLQAAKHDLKQENTTARAAIWQTYAIYAKKNDYEMHSLGDAQTFTVVLCSTVPQKEDRVPH